MKIVNSNVEKQQDGKQQTGRFGAMYHAFMTHTSDQIDGAAVWVSRLAVRLRLSHAIVCPRCKRDVTWSPQYRQLRLCASCNYHFPISARQRLTALADPHSFSPLAQRRESVIIGTAKIKDKPSVLILFDFQHHGGTMSVRAGQMIVQAFEYATEQRLPVIAITASGGVRIQEGMPALLEMASTTQAVLDFQKGRLPLIAVLTHPTTGGVYASFASLGDVLLAEPGALIGFAGPRVAEAATGEELPPDSHRAETALQNGIIDAIVPRNGLRDILANLLRIMGSPSSEAKSTESHDREVSEPGDQADRRSKEGASPLDLLAIARHPERPTARDYIARMFGDFVELHGDRLEKDDPKMIVGVGRFDGRPVAVVAQMRERGQTHERGASAAGYRKAERLIRLAARIGPPIITLVDTPGADPGYESERHGIAGAIAHTLAALLSAPVPTVSVVIGEGTSGGALALAAADRVLMQENAVYAVISPEGASAILNGGDSRQARHSEHLSMTVHDLLRRGIVDQAIEEPAGGAHTDYDAAATAVSAALRATLSELQSQSEAERLALRRARYRAATG